MRNFDRIIEAFVGAVVRVRSPCFDRLDIAAQFVSEDDPWFAKLSNQCLEETLCEFGILSFLHNNIKDLTIFIDRTPKPMRLTTDCDHDLVQMPLVVRSWAISTDAICEIAIKAVYP
jgi:hypothetical protein